MSVVTDRPGEEHTILCTPSWTAHPLCGKKVMLEHAEMLLLRVGGMVMDAVTGVFSEEEDLSECVRLLALGGGGGPGG